MGEKSKGISSSNPAVLTVFNGGKHDNDAARAEVVELKSFEDLRDYLSRLPVTLTDKDTAPLIIPARCRGGRKKGDIDARRTAVLDVDESELSPSAAADILRDLLEIDFALHTTHSHGLNADLHSYRIWLNYIAGSAEELEAVLRHVFGLLCVDPTPESWRPGGFYGPCVHPDRAVAYEFDSFVNGAPLPFDWRRHRVATGTSTAQTMAVAVRSFDIDLVREQLSHIPNGDYHTWFVVGVALHSTRDATALELYKEWSASQDYGDYSADACDEVWRRADATRDGGATLAKIEFLARENDWRPSAFRDFAGVTDKGIHVPDIDRTDAEFAARIVADHGHQLRFIQNLESWIRFDGRRWRMDLGLAARQLAMETGREIASEITARIASATGPELTWARRCNSSAGIRAAIELAQPSLNLPASALDADRMVINLTNGTLDLRTHRLRDHDPADFITKVAPASYRPGVRCDRWDVFLREVLPDGEMRSFFQKAMGCALQGGQAEKAFFVVHGPPDGGKSTALNACARALGTSVRSDQATGDDDSAVVTRFYAESTGMATFATARYGGGNRPELAKLMGARIVIVNEIKAELLESSIVKAWTGGDQVPATPKYGHPLSFYADGTIFFVGNELPSIDFNDDAMWERTVILPFANSVPPDQRIRNLVEMFDLDAVMAWMIEGHRMYVEQGGLHPPKVARLARDRHRTESDPLADFWATCVRVVDADTAIHDRPWVSRQNLFRAYERWCMMSGVRQHDRISQAVLSRYVNRRAPGLDRKRAGVRGWLGIEEINPMDEEDDPEW